jgi:hypothetical protein
MGMIPIADRNWATEESLNRRCPGGPSDEPSSRLIKEGVEAGLADRAVYSRIR